MQLLKDTILKVGLGLSEANSWKLAREPPAKPRSRFLHSSSGAAPNEGLRRALIAQGQGPSSCHPVPIRRAMPVPYQSVDGMLEIGGTVCTSQLDGLSRSPKRGKARTVQQKAKKRSFLRYSAPMRHGCPDRSRVSSFDLHAPVHTHRIPAGANCEMMRPFQRAAWKDLFRRYGWNVMTDHKLQGSAPM